MKNSFDMVAGYANEKKELQDVCRVLQSVDRFKKLGLRMPKGILLVGNPGVGKSVLAESLIKESNLNCIRINFDAVEETKLAQYLDNQFKKAIKNGPSIIFMDELDKVCGEDSPFSSLTDMDNSRRILKAINDNESDKIMLLATINDKDMLHPAICRSGRFDRTIDIPLPSLEDRKEIINLYAKDKQFDRKVNFETLAKITGTFSGADIETIINESGLNAVINGREVIKQEDVDKAVNRIIFKATEKENSLEKENSKVVATHETGHLLAGLILDSDSVGSVSIIPQGESSGHVKMGMESNKQMTKKQVLNLITISLAGKAAEEIFFPNEVYLGATSDIKKAFSFVNRLLTVDCAYGFEYYSDAPEGHFIQMSNLSENKCEKIEKKKQEIINGCYEKAKEIIISNIDLAKVYIDKLSKKYTLTREEVLKVYKENKKAA